MSDTRTALAEIRGDGRDYIDEVDPIYDLVAAFFEGRSGLEREDFATLFRLFEEFPDDDCSHVLWEIIHGVEYFGGYEDEMIASIRRAPSAVPLLLLNRLLNGGFEAHAGISYLSLLEDTTKRADCSNAIVDRAVGYLDSHRS